MLLFIVWLAIEAGLAYEITTHGMWRDGIAAVAVLAFLLWGIGGLLSFPVIHERRRKREREEMLKAARAAAAQPQPK